MGVSMPVLVTCHTTHCGRTSHGQDLLQESCHPEMALNATLSEEEIVRKCWREGEIGEWYQTSESLVLLRQVGIVCPTELHAEPFSQGENSG